jgi:hypothetical protein
MAQRLCIDGLAYEMDAFIDAPGTQFACRRREVRDDGALHACENPTGP